MATGTSIEQSLKSRITKWNSESFFRTASIRDIHTVGHPVLNASGDLVQFVGSSMDITERKRGEQATRLLAADCGIVARCDCEQRSGWRNYQLE